MLKPVSYLYGQPLPTVSINEHNSSIPIWKEKHTTRMYYFSACIAWAGIREGRTIRCICTIHLLSQERCSASLSMLNVWMSSPGFVNPAQEVCNSLAARKNGIFMHDFSQIGH